MLINCSTHLSDVHVVFDPVRLHPARCVLHGSRPSTREATRMNGVMAWEQTVYT